MKLWRWKREVRRLRLAPGDLVVVRVASRLTPEQAARIQEQIKQVAPDNKALICELGTKIEVLKMAA